MDRNQPTSPREYSALRAIDAFIPTSINSDQDKLIKYRIFISVCWGLVAILMIGGLINAFAYDLPMNNIILGYAITIPLMIVFFALPFALKYFNCFQLCVNTALFFLSISMFAGVALTGGPLTSTVTFMLIIPPMFGFCLGGFRVGFFWVASVYLILAAGCYAEISGFEYPFLTNNASYKTNQMVTLAIGFIAAIMIMMIYEYNNGRLQKSLQKQKESYKHYASHDVLTGVGNRFLFYKQLNKTWHRANRHQEKFALLFIDLDGFKAINDHYGHDIGDKVLITIANRLQQAIRNSDTLCRVGGDEFTIILERLENQPELEAAIERVNQIFKTTIDIIPDSHQLGASIGTATYPDDTNDLKELEKIADQRMYQNKKA